VSPQDRARDGFIAAYGNEPVGIAFAPGRVNLIGEHVDYNDGLVLPMPISTGTAVAWGRSSGTDIEAVALDFADARDRFSPDDLAPHQPADWRSYLRGMTTEMAMRGANPRGMRLALAGSNPRGAGLSSSASLCIALGRAFGAASDTSWPAPELAQAAQMTEHRWADVQCGIMDQMAIAAGEPDHALLLDCRDLATRQVAMPTDWAVAIIQSGVTRGLVDGHYNARRRDCEAAAAALGLSSLRDASLAMIADAGLDPVIAARAVHVVSEIARTSAVVHAIEAHDIAALGNLLRDSHASLRDQFEVSVPAVDRLVDLANAAVGPSGGARMTGGGFGGAVVAVLERSAVPGFIAALEHDFVTRGAAPPHIMIEGTGGPAAAAMP
jgi:galactokinase